MEHSMTEEKPIPQSIANLVHLSSDYLHNEREILFQQAKLQKACLEKVCAEIKQFLSEFPFYTNLKMTFKGRPNGDFSYAKGWKIEFHSADRLIYKHNEIGTHIINNLKKEGTLTPSIKEEVKFFQEQINQIVESLKMVKPVSAYTLFDINDTIKIQMYVCQNGYKIEPEI